nr:MAG TPA: Nucleoside 2-deoxyribosyltransferase [Caudoviricetes sp.]
MIVILEGLERTGKTTLAKIFEERGFINFKDHNHLRNFSVENIAERLDSTLSTLIALDKNGINIVLDRFHISEYVYSTIKRENDTSLFKHIWYIDEVLSHLNTKLIYLTRKIDEQYIKDYPEAVFDASIRMLQKEFEYRIDKSYIEDKEVYDLSDWENEENIVDEIIASSKKYDFYLASPFFNDDQIEREERIKSLLRTYGYKVYSPREHGVVGNLSDSISVQETFNSNVEAINDSKKVLAITDGKDMGTIWEAGYAYGKGIPIVYYAETLGDNPFNIMLSESGIGIYTDQKKLEDACKMYRFDRKAEVQHE